jgi:hypothetical protein
MRTKMREMGGLDQNILDTLVRGAESFSRTAQQFQRTATQAASTAQRIAENPLRAAFNKIEVRTAYSKPIVYTPDDVMASIKAPPGEPGTARFFKPTIILDVPVFGQRIIAPYGAATADEWKSNTFKAIAIFLGGLALYTAGGYYLGYKAGQRSKR